MSNIEPLKPGQEVFLRRPVQIYATVTGTCEGDWGLPEEQVRYAVRLVPMEQLYLSQDLELSMRAPANQAQANQMPANQAQLDYASAEPAMERGHFSEMVLNLGAGDSFFVDAQETDSLIARRAYELYEYRGFTHGQDIDDWLRASSEILLHVPADITETETEITIHADVPGVSAKDLEVRVASRSLCITGERQTLSELPKGRRVHSERRSNRIFRVLELPSDIHPEKVTASVSGGVLEVKLLKAEFGQVVPTHAKAATA